MNIISEICLYYASFGVHVKFKALINRFCLSFRQAVNTDSAHDDILYDADVVGLIPSILVVLEVEVLGEGPVDELGEEDLAATVLVDRVELCKRVL